MLLPSDSALIAALVAAEADFDCAALIGFREEDKDEGAEPLENPSEEDVLALFLDEIGLSFFSVGFGLARLPEVIAEVLEVLWDSSHSLPKRASLSALGM